MLGKTFENLLAAHTPETQENARRQTGSYYTPREIVDYMTAESLTESLLAKIGGQQKEREQIRALFNYDDPGNDPTKPKFEKTISKKLIYSIANIKFFDPAVGSGAFPMSALHLLLLALSKLDPENNEWKKLPKNKVQKDIIRAFDKTDDQKRKKQLLEFERKLYLIQNSIFGTDIQPIACQIAKLRFFISLAIEQTPNKNAQNYGIKPLPNLETRIIATDTLIALVENKTNIMLGEKETNLKKAEIIQNRERYFNASNRKDKFDCIKKDKRLRQELKKQLITQGFHIESANKIAEWDPYNPNALATNWFDAEYMFGIADGFDIVIGNPPYIQLQKDCGRLANLYESKHYQTFVRSGDIYCLFYERGKNLLATGGHLCYISSNKFMRTRYGKKLRHFLRNDTTLKTIIDFGELPVFEAGTDPAIVLFQNTLPSPNVTVTASIIKTTSDILRISESVADNGFNIRQNNLSVDGWTLTAETVHKLLTKLQKTGIPLNDYVNVLFRGVTTGLDMAFVITETQKRQLIAEDHKSAEIIKPWLTGGEIKQWHAQQSGLHVIFTQKTTDIEKYPAVKNHLLSHKRRLIERSTPEKRYWYALSSPTAYHENFVMPKIVYNETSKEIHSFIDHDGLYINKTAFIIFCRHPEFLLGIMNSELMDFYYRHVFPSWGDPWNKGRIQFQGVRMAAVPICVRDPTRRRKISHCVKRILNSPHDKNVPELTAEINALVYEIYGLTKKEIALVKEWQSIRVT